MTALKFDDFPPHIPASRAARQLGVCRATLYIYLKARNCPRFGGRYYITPEWLDGVERVRARHDR